MLVLYCDSITNILHMNSRKGKQEGAQPMHNLFRKFKFLREEKNFDLLLVHGNLNSQSAYFFACKLNYFNL